MNTAHLGGDILLEIDSLQNPFTVARLREDIRITRAASQALSCHNFHGRAAALLGLSQELLTRQLDRAVLVLECELGEEMQKPNHIRFSGSTHGGEDDAWRSWVVFDKALSAQVLSRESESWRGEEETGLRLGAADVWNTLGFDPSHSPLGDVSPSGRMFRREISVKVINGYVIISQTGARDV